MKTFNRSVGGNVIESIPSVISQKMLFRDKAGGSNVNASQRPPWNASLQRHHDDYWFYLVTSSSCEMKLVLDTS